MIRDHDRTQPPAAPAHRRARPAGGSGRYLVVNADDFGMSPAVNQGILEAHDHGVVTSASLLVRWPAAEQAAEQAALRPRLGVGLHLDLGEWFWDGTAWRTGYERVAIDDPGSVAREIECQLLLFRRLVGRDPTHLDSHQNVHLREPVRRAVGLLARRLSVPVWGRTCGVAHCKSFYGQTSTGEPLPEAIEVEALLRIVRSLAPGITELRCHPGAALGPGPGYRAERSVETRSLCDTRVLDEVRARGITLCNFADRSILP